MHRLLHWHPTTEEIPGARVEWDGDVDLDGDNDLLVSRANGTSLELELYLGPSFTRDPRVGTWPFEPQQTSLALGDGDLDALVGTRRGEPAGVSEVFTQGAPWAFSHAEQLLPPGLLVDLDQDGDVDAVGARITFNRRVP